MAFIFFLSNYPTPPSIRALESLIVFHGHADGLRNAFCARVEPQAVLLLSKRVPSWLCGGILVYTLIAPARKEGRYPTVPHGFCYPLLRSDPPRRHLLRSANEQHRPRRAVPNIAWQSYLQLSLHFEPYMLGFMAAAGSVMTCLGVTAYKNYFFHISWR